MRPGLGWAVFRQVRVLVVLVLVSVVGLVAGVVLAWFVVPPAPEREPVRPGLITAEVELRELRSTVVTRADVSFADPVRVDPAVPEGATSAVVTGKVPKVGGVVESGDVVLEVSSRPVFALAGKFPAFRSLSVGMTGRDVTMLRSALKKLGYSAGAKSSTYDAPLANAVKKLYTDHGYSPPGAQDRDRQLAVRDATDAVDDATTVLAAAKRALKKAEKAKGVDAEGVDKAELKAAVKDATRSLERAKEALRYAQEDALTPLPVSEVVFLTAMPRRVDAVNVKLGGVIGEGAGEGDPDGEEDGGAALVLSGNKIKVEANVLLSEASLVSKGDLVEIKGPENTVIDATVSGVCAEAADAEVADADQRCKVGIKLGDLGDVDRSELLGDVQATIQVGASSPDSLAVPVSAVSADAANQARVQRVLPGSTPQDPEAETEWVTIEPGLSAEGYVEIKSSTPKLAAGDLVVLGVAGSDEPDDEAAEGQDAGGQDASGDDTSESEQ